MSNLSTANLIAELCSKLNNCSFYATNYNSDTDEWEMDDLPEQPHTKCAVSSVFDSGLMERVQLKAFPDDDELGDDSLLKVVDLMLGTTMLNTLSRKHCNLLKNEGF